MADGLNPEQLEVVKHRGSPLLVLAGPGSGKTRSVTHRIEDLIVSDKVRPNNILAITFTNKAAGEIRNRLKPQVGLEAIKALTIRTFHSLGSLILRRDGLPVGIKSDFQIFDEDDQEHLIEAILEIRRGQETGKGGFSTEEFKELINARKEGYGDLDQDGYTESLIEEYESRLRAANACDFSDLLYLPVKLFESKPEVLARYQRWFQHVQVDEFQDASVMQYRLVRNLCPDGKRLCVVGDDDQLIYEWRGAKIETILDFAKVYPGTKIVRLERNYRSDGQIVKRANEIIQRNVKRHQKTIWTSRPEGTAPQFYAALDEADEAQKVVEAVVRLNMNGVPYTEMAILYRNNAFSRKFEDGLRYRGIPYTIVNGHTFYNRSEIRNALSMLRLISNPSSVMDLDRFLKAPPTRGVGPKTLSLIDNYARQRGMTLNEVFGTPDECLRVPDLARGLAKKAEEFGQVFRSIARLKASCVSVEETLEEALRLSGIVKHYEAHKKEEERRRAENLGEFVTTAGEIDRRYLEEVPEEDRGVISPLTFFLEQVALVQESDKTPKKDKKPEGVSLMTLHACKGLEFEFVALVGLEDGVLPDPRSGEEEERRLFYVGFTRAKKYLLLTCASHRTVWGELKTREPSRFLVQMGVASPRGQELPAPSLPASRRLALADVPDVPEV